MDSVLSALAGLCAGAVSGGALCAFYLALGLVTKPAYSLKIPGTAKLQAAAVALGAIFGTIMTLYGAETAAGPLLAGAFGLFAGLYIGIFIACLAEVVSLLPALKKIVSLRVCIILVLFFFAAGKLTGSLLYWLLGGS